MIYCPTCSHLVLTVTTLTDQSPIIDSRARAHPRAAPIQELGEY